MTLIRELVHKTLAAGNLHLRHACQMKYYENPLMMN